MIYFYYGDSMIIYEGKYFEIVFCDWCQDFLGQCIISGHKESLSDMTSDEWIELGKLESELERIMKKLFNATMFNFACLMNNAYRDGEIPHVHYWFFPRYKEKVKIFNKVFKDKHFGYNFWKWNLSKLKRQKDIFISDERKEIFKMIEKEFNVNNVI